MTAQVETSQPLASNAHWVGLVERIQAGDREADEELYHVFAQGIRFQLCRRIGQQDMEDRLHDIYLITRESIRKGELREPERLMGYVRTILRRQVAEQIDHLVTARRRSHSIEVAAPVRDHRPNPERIAIERQTIKIALSTLKGLGRRDREILVRFYLQEQKSGQICREMKLTETQFRLMKSRAKARFGKLGRRRFER